MMNARLDLLAYADTKPVATTDQTFDTMKGTADMNQSQTAPAAIKPLVIYHGNCADGFSAAWCFHHADPAGFEFCPAGYNAPPPDVTGRDVYIADFSYPYDVLVQMSFKARSITILDHHKSAAEDLAGLPAFRTDWAAAHLPSMSRHAVSVQCYSQNMPDIGVCFDMERSGAGITWDFLFPETPRPLLLGHIEDRDLWRFRLPQTRDIQATVFSYEYTFQNWDRLMAADQVELMKLTVAGAAIERKHHKDIAELVRVCQRTMHIGGHEVPVASLPYTMSSDAGALMAVGVPFAACYWDTSTHRIFSLRSAAEGLDVSVIAREYGGGGHKHASGFKVPREHVLAGA
ncbi:hypothetical protein GCM10007242_45190 [Pigmentiphaga litoralis]|uniref:hypothetical protein n=1 Tax=Pigmentiphaga litoralis TaxID=516702 RepID=UPI0019B334D8|nr:hypothetical protein [Pigmentiphaga litoralis]GGX33078.1 hypothetical protein GCM10007242_45190 [Pigmentiphaga litoralis]